MTFSMFCRSDKKDEISLQIVGNDVSHYYAMIVPRNSPFKEMLCQGLMSLRQSGMIFAIIARYANSTKIS